MAKGVNPTGSSDLQIGDTDSRSIFSIQFFLPKTAVFLTYPRLLNIAQLFLRPRSQNKTIIIKNIGMTQRTIIDFQPK